MTSSDPSLIARSPIRPHWMPSWRKRSIADTPSTTKNTLWRALCGAPVYDHRGVLVGAIGISGPAGRVTLERIDEFGDVVKETADALSARMGFDPGLQLPRTAKE